MVVKFKPFSDLILPFRELAAEKVGDCGCDETLIFPSYSTYIQTQKLAHTLLNYVGIWTVKVSKKRLIYDKSFIQSCILI